jgi:hypothetical protein
MGSDPFFILHDNLSHEMSHDYLLALRFLFRSIMTIGTVKNNAINPFST